MAGCTSSPAEAEGRRDNAGRGMARRRPLSAGRPRARGGRVRRVREAVEGPLRRPSPKRKAGLRGVDQRPEGIRRPSSGQLDAAELLAGKGEGAPLLRLLSTAVKRAFLPFLAAAARVARAAVLRRKRSLQSLAEFPTANLLAECGELQGTSKNCLDPGGAVSLCLSQDNPRGACPRSPQQAPRLPPVLDLPLCVKLKDQWGARAAQRESRHACV